MLNNKIIIRNFGLQPYEYINNTMHYFTDTRNENTLDEIWFVEHLPVFTQGKTGKIEDVINAGNIPIIITDRGGKITYHGPGQQVMYILLNLKRRKLKVRKLLILLEHTVINTLYEIGINANQHVDAPGVYVGKMKICSIGLGIRKWCSYHGLALNINMDLSPFLRIKPCGYANMKMTQISHFVKNPNIEFIHFILIRHLLLLLNNTSYKYITI